MHVYKKSLSSKFETKAMGGLASTQARELQRSGVNGDSALLPTGCAPQVVEPSGGLVNSQEKPGTCPALKVTRGVLCLKGGRTPWKSSAVTHTHPGFLASTVCSSP